MVADVREPRWSTVFAKYEAQSMLFILNNTEDGLYCQAIERGQFDAWVKERTDGIKPEHHPRFVTTVPTESSPPSEYMVIDGKAVVPKPVTTVTTYSLDT